MVRGIIFFAVFCGHLVLSIVSTKYIYRKTTNEKEPLRSILRSGVIALFFAPVIYCRDGILPVPALIILGYSFDLVGHDRSFYFSFALGSMLITFIILFVINIIVSDMKGRSKT